MTISQWESVPPSELSDAVVSQACEGGEGGEMIGLRRDNDHPGRYDDRPAVPWLIWEMVSEQLY